MNLIRSMQTLLSAGLRICFFAAALYAVRRNRHKEDGCTGKCGGSSTLHDLSLRYLWIDVATQDSAIGATTCVIRSLFH